MQCNDKSQKPIYLTKRTVSFALFSLLAITLCLKLGFWQLDRAAYKASIQQTPSKILTNLSLITEQNRHQKLRITGHFDNNNPVLLDNQTQNKKVGYNLYLPFISEENAILVNLGWVAASSTRNSLPLIVPIKGQHTIIGTLSSSQGSPILLGENIKKHQHMLVVQKTISADIQAHISYPISSQMLQLNRKNQFGYTNYWQPSVMQPEKHNAYAAQWFLLSFAIFISSAVWMTKTHKK